VHEINEIVVNVGIAETVFPYEGLEVRTGTNGDCMAGRHQCSAQCDIGLNITSRTNRQNQDFHVDASLANRWGGVGAGGIKPTGYPITLSFHLHLHRYWNISTKVTILT
jgi:hypothetical protein